MVDIEQRILDFLKKQGGTAMLKEIGNEVNLDPIKEVYPIVNKLKKEGKVSIEGRSVKLLLPISESRPAKPKRPVDLETKSSPEITLSLIIDFMKENKGKASLDEISEVFDIPKYGPKSTPSAWNLLNQLKSDKLVVQKGDQWSLTEYKDIKESQNEEVMEISSNPPTTTKSPPIQLESQPSPQLSQSGSAPVATPNLTENMAGAQLIQAFVEALKQVVQQTSGGVAGLPLTPPDDWQMAEEPFKQDIKKEEVPVDTNLIIRPSEDESEPKELIGLPTGTLIDKLFLKVDGTALGGLPYGGQFAITGLPGAGKSILMEEIAINVANQGYKVFFLTSEDQWTGKTLRMDLNSRMQQKAKILGIDWKKIALNLIVLDIVTNSELRTWDTLIRTYRYIVEKEQIELAIFDSVTVLESYRGALKFRVIEIARYNQLHGITGLFVNQRREESWDSYEMAGGIGIAHALDGTIIIDYGRVYHPDQEMELELKHGWNVNIMRVLDCRICGFIRERQRIKITHDGFIREIGDNELGTEQEKIHDYERRKIKKIIHTPSKDQQKEDAEEKTQLKISDQPKTNSEKEENSSSIKRLKLKLNK